MSNSNTFKIIATTQGFKKAQGEVKGLTGSMKKFATGLVSAAAAYKAFAVGLESVQLAGRLEAVEKGFKTGDSSVYVEMNVKGFKPNGPSCFISC